MTDFDPNHEHGHVTKCGYKARIICTAARNDEFPIVALVEIDGYEVPCAYSPRGTIYQGDGDAGFDLINAPAPKRVAYVNVYAKPDGSIFAGGGAFADRAEADGHANASRVGCNRIEARFDE